jgi:DNA-binding response OmpR family regulator
VAFCSLPGSLFDPLLDWLRDLGAQVTPMPIRSLPLEWFDRYATGFDAALVDADFLGDEGSMIDFGMRLRRFAPDLPIIMVSSRVAQSDYSTERMAICDVTLRAPLAGQALLEALAVAITNHDRWHEGRFGRMQSR